MYRRTKMNMSEAMKVKRQIQLSCGIDLKMLDVPQTGFVLTIERTSINVNSYKLLANYAAENNLSLQLEIGNFIISDQPLSEKQRPSEN
jgi:hypothetical protein